MFQPKNIIKGLNKMKRIKQFITKCFNKEKDAYCWYNTHKCLSQEEIADIKTYFDKKEYNFMLIINGCSELRPQRTWSTFPTFLKGTDGCHILFKSPFNAFILCSWMEDYTYEHTSYEEDIKELLATLPCELETIVLTKKEK